jgi:hypothetical protein
MRQYFFIVIIIISSIFPSLVFARVQPAGIPHEALWFSQDPFVLGDKITISTLLYNSSPNRLRGTLVLYDGTTTIGSKPFLLQGGGASTIVTYPWTATAGAHAFHAEITAKQFFAAGNVEVADSIETPQTTVVDRVVLAPPVIPPPEAKKVIASNEIKNPVAPLHSLLLLAASALPEAGTESLLPDPTRGTTLPVVSQLEDFRKVTLRDEERALRRSNDVIGTTQSTTKSTSTGSTDTARSEGWSTLRQGVASRDVVRTPFAYAALFFHLVSESILAHPDVFYCVLIVSFVVFIRIVWGIFF